MTEEQIYNVAVRKQQVILENNRNLEYQEYYKSNEFLGELIQDIVNGLNFTKYCFERNRNKHNELNSLIS